MWIERNAELRAVEAALQPSKLAQVHGPLGVGKTALVGRLRWRGERRDVSLAVGSADEARRALAVALRIARDDVRTLERAIATRDGELVVVDDAERIAELLPELLRPRTTGAHVLLVSRVRLDVAPAVELGTIPDASARRLLTDAAARPLNEAIVDALIARMGGLPLAIAIARAFVAEIDERSVLDAFDELADGDESLAAMCTRALSRLPSRDAALVHALAVFPTTFTVDEAAAAFASKARGAGIAACRRLLALGFVTSQSRHGTTRLALAAPLRDVSTAKRRPTLTIPVTEAILQEAEAELARTMAAPLEEGWSRLALEEPNLTLVAAQGARPSHRERAATLVHRVRSALGPLRVPVVVAAVKPTKAPLALARGELARLAGDHASARRSFGLALSLAPRHGALEAEARRRSAQLARIEGAWHHAAAEIDRAIACYRDLGDRHGEAQCVSEEAFALAARGRFDEAAARQRTAIALLDGRGPDHAIATSYLAVHLHRAGRLVEAEALHRAALAEHEGHGAARYVAAEHMHLGYVAHELGREADALSSLERARAAQRALGDAGLEALSCVYLARVMADVGQVSDGEQLVAEANVLLRDVAAPAQHAAVEVVLGHLAMQRGAFRVAADAYAAALGRVRTPTVGFEALTGAYLAAALFAAGDRGAKVRKALRASERMLRGVRHPFLLHAHAILGAFVRAEIAEAPPPEAVAQSSEVRRALRFARARDGRPFRIEAEARFALTPEGQRVELSRRRALRLLVLALVEARSRAPGVALSVDAIASAGWPGERLRPTAAEQRAYTAVWTLRRDLFGEALLRRDDGYLLRPDVNFEIL